MPRPPRDFGPGIHHIGTGASGPSPYYRDDVDRATWTRLFVKTARRYDWTVVIVVQLGTHWHAMVETHDYSLPKGMQFLNGEYSKSFNARHLRLGYLVRDRYWSRRKSTEAEIVHAFTYAANNPVLAGLVARAEDWAWSSYATTLGITDAFDFVDASIILRMFGATEAAAREALRRHVTALAASARERP